MLSCPECTPVDRLDMCTQDTYVLSAYILLFVLSACMPLVLSAHLLTDQICALRTNGQKLEGETDFGFYYNKTHRQMHCHIPSR